jgi:hypothetical protein
MFLRSKHFRTEMLQVKSEQVLILRMPSSGMWRRVGLVGAYVSEECVTYIFRVEKSEIEEKR